MLEFFPFIKDIVFGLLGMVTILAGYAYTQGQKRMDKLENDQIELTKELNNVKLQYLEKAEIEKIESRIDKRFDEMRELVLSLIKKVQE